MAADKKSDHMSQWLRIRNTSNSQHGTRSHDTPFVSFDENRPHDRRTAGVMAAHKKSRTISMGCALSPASSYMAALTQSVATA
jgi:hypothetical protein